jgi:hypothetical protein
MLFDILKERFDILSPIDPDLFITSHPHTIYFFVRKNNNLHLSISVPLNKLSELFAAYNATLPPVVSELFKDNEFALVDLTTINDTMIKFYVNVTTPIPSLPSVIPDFVTTNNRHLIRLSVLVNSNNTIEEYKYYWVDDNKETYIHRFNGLGNFIEENIEYHSTSPSLLTEADLLAVDERLAGIDISKYGLGRTSRTSNDNLSIALIGGNYNIADFSNGGFKEQVAFSNPVDHTSK